MMLDQKIMDAEILTAMGLLDEAAQAYAALADEDPFQASLGLGLIALERGDHAAAVATFRRAATLRAGDADAILALGLGRLAAGQTALALIDLGRARALGADTGAVSFALGRALARSGCFAEAEEMFAEATQAAPLNARVWLDLARCQVAQRNVERAMRTLFAAVEAAPLALELWLALIELCDFAGAHALGRHVAGFVRSGLGMGDPRLLFAEALLALKGGDVEHVRELVDRLDEQVEPSAEGATELAKLCLAAGDLEAAREHVGAALLREPESAEALYVLGFLHALGDEDEEAARAFGLALAADAGHWRAALGLADLRYAMRPSDGLARAEAMLDEILG